MKSRDVPASTESPRFIKQKETIDTLAMAQERLVALNYDYCELSSDTNPRLRTDPYEGAVLFSIDERPSNRASTIAFAPSYGLENDPRLEFNREAIRGRRIILDQSALKNSLDDGEKHREQSFWTSKMNPGQQTVWAQPLIHEDKNVAAVQLAYSTNQNPDWILSSNEDVDKVWKKHRRSMDEVAKGLADLALKTTSLSKKLELMPPVTPNAIVIEWDVVNSRLDALSDLYATQEAYLEVWKAARAKIMKNIGHSVLDRGDGEFIILPLEHMDLNNPAIVRQYSKREILPLINELVDKHTEISTAFRMNILKKIKVAVHVGNIEEDQDGGPTGQVLYELKNLADSSAKPLTFSPAAEEMLF